MDRNIHKRTTWIPGHVKPARPGVYERSFGGWVLFAEWTGLQWLGGANTPAKAIRMRSVSPIQETADWRGLAVKP